MTRAYQLAIDVAEAEAHWHALLDRIIIGPLVDGDHPRPRRDIDERGLDHQARRVVEHTRKYPDFRAVLLDMTPQ